MDDDRRRSNSDVEDPLHVARDRAKADDDLPEEGPPVAQMATTYGSSFVESAQHAEALATENSSDAGPPLGDGGNPGGATDSAPVERAPQQTIHGDG